MGGRVGTTPRDVAPPSEPGRRVIPHPAQAARLTFKVFDGTPFDRCSRVTFTRRGIQLFPWMSALLLVVETSHPATSAPFQVGHSPIRQVMDSLCLSAVGIRFLAVLSHEGMGSALRRAYCLGRPYRGFHFLHRQAASGELASLRWARGTISAGPLIPADHRSNKDVSTTFVPFCVTTLQPRLHGCSTRSQLILAWISGVVPYVLFAFTACLRPRDYSRRPGSRETGVRSSPGLVSPPSGSAT